MSSHEDTVCHGYIIGAPKTSDLISGALYAAFGRQDTGTDDFTALLREIDTADRACRRS